MTLARVIPVSRGAKSRGAMMIPRASRCDAPPKLVRRSLSPLLLAIAMYSGGCSTSDGSSGTATPDGGDAGFESGAGGASFAGSGSAGPDAGGSGSRDAGSGDSGTGGSGNGTGGGSAGGGFSCALEGVADGNPLITGVDSFDGFFSAVLDLTAHAENLSNSIDAELAAIATSLDMPSPPNFGDDFSTALQLKYELSGFYVDFMPPHCIAETGPVRAAALLCDASLSSDLRLECTGGCQTEIDLAGLGACPSDSELYCTTAGTDMACTGTCEGTCRIALSSPSVCNGKCLGTCSGTLGFAQSCDGNCTGDCEYQYQGDASCSGYCSGACQVAALNSTCPSGESDATCRADISAEDSLACDTSCSGEVQVPWLSSRCEAQVYAVSAMETACDPPALEISYTFDAMATADSDPTGTEAGLLSSWLDQMRTRLATVFALDAQRQQLVGSIQALQFAASGVIAADAAATPTPVNTQADYRVKYCTPEQLGASTTLLSGADAMLTASGASLFSLILVVYP